MWLVFFFNEDMLIFDYVIWDVNIIILLCIVVGWVGLVFLFVFFCMLFCYIGFDRLGYEVLGYFLI